MSVSVSEGGTQSQVDLNAIVSGGDAFMQRLKALQAAKKEHDEALKKYAIGTDVVRAMQDVQAREQAAIEACTAAVATADKIVAEAKAQEKAILDAANAAAADIRAKAAADGDALAREVDEAHAALTAWSEKTKHEANSLMNEAVAAKAEADQLLKEGWALTAKANAATEKARLAHEAADKRHTKIKAVCGQVNDLVDSLAPFME